MAKLKIPARRASTSSATETPLTERLWDDPVASIQIGYANQSAKVELWISESKEIPSFREVQTLILDLIRDVSNGVVLENGQ